jgi:para-nitrobenzyl esterase
MKTALPMAVLAAALAGLAATPPTPGHAEKYVITAIPAKMSAKLTVTSPAYKNGADIPFENTQYRGNIFPGVNWSKGPEGTKSYVVIMQGGLGGVGEAVSGTSIHFTLMNVPASVISLATGLTTPPDGAVYGVNVHGDNQQFAGPHTHGFTKHEYHVQVFALDTVLPNDPKMSFETLETGMTGHVLQSGEIVGLAAMDPESPEAAQLKAAQPKK